MFILIFKTTSLLSDLNGEKVAIADCLPPPPPKKNPTKNPKQTNKQKTTHPRILLSTLMSYPMDVV